MRRTLILISLVCLTNFAWAVNKCTSIDGRVIFQDTSCSNSGITVAEDINRKKVEEKNKAAAAKTIQGNPNSALPEDIQKQLVEAKNNSDEALAAARARCINGVPEYPSIGMTEFEFKNCTQIGILFDHSDQNITKTAGGTLKQLVYGKNIGVRYIYIRNGVISAIQH